MSDFLNLMFLTGSYYQLHTTLRRSIRNFLVQSPDYGTRLTKVIFVKYLNLKLCVNNFAIIITFRNYYINIKFE